MPGEERRRCVSQRSRPTGAMRFKLRQPDARRRYARRKAIVEPVFGQLKEARGFSSLSLRGLTRAAGESLLACLAHNLVRWTTVIGLPGSTIRTARTIRRRLLCLPGRLTRSARQWTLHLPARWPWQHDFIRALARIRALPAPA